MGSDQAANFRFSLWQDRRPSCGGLSGRSIPSPPIRSFVAEVVTSTCPAVVVLGSLHGILQNRPMSILPFASPSPTSRLRDFSNRWWFSLFGISSHGSSARLTGIRINTYVHYGQSRALCRQRYDSAFGGRSAWVGLGYKEPGLIQAVFHFQDENQTFSWPFRAATHHPARAFPEDSLDRGRPARRLPWSRDSAEEYLRSGRWICAPRGEHRGLPGTWRRR